MYVIFWMWQAKYFYNYLCPYKIIAFLILICVSKKSYWALKRSFGLFLLNYFNGNCSISAWLMNIKCQTIHLTSILLVRIVWIIEDWKQWKQTYLQHWHRSSESDLNYALAIWIPAKQIKLNHFGRKGKNLAPTHNICQTISR